jgi:hypothetical protein
VSIKSIEPDLMAFLCQISLRLKATIVKKANLDRGDCCLFHAAILSRFPVSRFVTLDLKMLNLGVSSCYEIEMYSEGLIR